MPHNVSSSQKAVSVLTALVTLIVFLLLFIFRAADDNRLTSWQWVFTGIDSNRIFLLLAFGIVIAYVVSKFSVPGQYAAPLLFCSSFLVCTVFWREPEVIVDVSRYFAQAKHLKVYGIKYFAGEWGESIPAWTDLPLVPFLYGLIFKLFGESRTYIQIFTTLLFAMTVSLTYLTGKILWDEDTGLHAGAFLLGMPYLYTQVPLMLIDIPAMFFLMLLIFTFIRALDRGAIWIMVSSVALFLAFFSKYSIWLMLSVLAVISIVYVIQNKNPSVGNNSITTQGLKHGIRTYAPRAALIVLIAGFFIGAVILWKFDVIAGQIKLLQEYQKPGLRRWGESFASSFLYQIHPYITIAALYSIYAAFRKRDLKYLIISSLIFIVVFLRIQRIRYIMVTFPMLALMASYGLQEIKNRELKKFIVACAVMSSLVIAMFVYLPFLKKISTVNLKKAGMFLNSLDAEKIEVITASSKHDNVNQAVSVPILDFFTEKNINYRYDHNFLPLPERYRESPLRFTWEYRNPAYYNARQSGSEKAEALVLISGAPEQPITAYIDEKTKKYKKFRSFDVSEGIFQHRTTVKVYYD